PNLGEAAIPQHLRRDVLRPLAGRAAQQGGQERTVRGLQLADHGGAQLGVSVERPDSRPQRLGAHRRIFVMQAEIDELPKRCGWRPDGVGQNTRNRYRGMAVDERRQRGGEWRPVRTGASARRRGGSDLRARLRAPEKAYRLEAATPAVHEREVLVAQQTGKGLDRKSTRLNSSHVSTSYAVFCLEKK